MKEARRDSSGANRDTKRRPREPKATPMGTEGRPKVSPGVAQGRQEATKVAQRDPNGCPWPPKGNPVRPEDAQGTQKGTAKVSDRSASGPPGLYIEIRTAAAVGISICKMKFLSGVEIYTRYQVPGNNTRSPTSAQQAPSSAHCGA